MKNKKIIIWLLIIVALAAILFLAFSYLTIYKTISSGDFRQDQLSNGRYRYLQTKIISLSNIEHESINNTYRKVYRDKYFKQENIYETWEDLTNINSSEEGRYRQNDLRSKTINQAGELIFDKAFIAGNYFTCLDCLGKKYVEEEIKGELPIDSELKDILNGLESDPWRSISGENQIELLFELQVNHNEKIRQKIFNFLKYNFWDEIDYLGKLIWEDVSVYGFRVIDKNTATINLVYFDTEKIRYLGEEKIFKTYTGDGLDDLVRLQKIVVLEEIYSDSNLGVNSDGLVRESEAEINQFLNQECSVDIDCEGITGYTIEPGSCRAALSRCVLGECALMCQYPEEIRNGFCTKYNKEIEAFINYSCQENEQGISRLVKETNSEFGICKLNYEAEKKIIFYECLDNEAGDIELLKELDRN